MKTLELITTTEEIVKNKVDSLREEMLIAEAYHLECNISRQQSENHAKISAFTQILEPGKITLVKKIVECTIKEQMIANYPRKIAAIISVFPKNTFDLQTLKKEISLSNR